jgi:long-subunit acyl-CoA synthetase (AMP-forming)
MPTRGEIAYGSAAMPCRPDGPGHFSSLAVDFHQGYGMTETAGNVTFLRPDDHRLGTISDSSVIRTAGRPHSAVEIALVDAGECGSVLVRPGRSSCAVPK